MGVQRTPNKSQQTKLTLKKKILPPLLSGFELPTFRSRVRRSNQPAILAPCAGLRCGVTLLSAIAVCSRSEFCSDGHRVFIILSLPSKGGRMRLPVSNSQPFDHESGALPTSYPGSQAGKCNEYCHLTCR